MDSSEIRTPIQSAPPAPINPVPPNTQKKVLDDEIVVGLDHDVEQIRDKLVADYLDALSIVGMGGIGKTTLATKVFNDAYVKHHFHVHVWVTVSQTYDKRAVLLQILESIRAKGTLEEASGSRLRELVHKSLMGRRCLIVIDDVWDKEAWDNLKILFPHDNAGSRVLLTTRLAEVAKHANSDGFIHHIGYLNKEEGWELLRQKVFHDNECPEWSIKPGMQIANNCKGLPLVMVVIAGILAKKAWNRNLWEEIAERTDSYIVGEESGCLETLGLSYNHLPLHLRECFLYLGGFPEDYKFKVRKLIWLWVAEGFIEQDANISLEDIAEGYLMDLTDRNLVIVDSKKSHGGVKACKMHDLIRELCLKKAKEEGFILQIERPVMSSNVITPPYKPIRKFLNIKYPDLRCPFTRNLRSILWFRYRNLWPNYTAKYLRSFVLLRVLDLENCLRGDFPSGMELLVHLRYLAIWIESEDFPSSICKLWNLQTLIYESSGTDVVLPSNISDLVNLRHLKSSKSNFDIGSIEKPMNLQTLSCVRFKDEACNIQKYFPCIKKLSCVTKSDKQNDFKDLTCLERLRLWSFTVHEKNQIITLPATLKTLTLAECCLSWSDMSIIQSLPNLQYLKLNDNAFSGSCWNTDGQEFPQLKFLRLGCLFVKQWEVYSQSFPCLKQLEIDSCDDLEEIPLEIGDIPTLELIKISFCSHSAHESVRRIQEDQQEMGNYGLKSHIFPSVYNVEGTRCLKPRPKDYHSICK
ncbi:putative late blight resistance protein homolog R1A-10 [Bidens hawaiensis]|uniref:putative late blight resistance protein homolog R1A-10 n=1 Tax=Bidens hawaiensis TaxID=980011 RepID=UPI00404A47BB